MRQVQDIPCLMEWAVIFLSLSLGLGIFLWRVLAQRVPVKLFITYGQTAWSMASHPVTFEARSFACNCDHAQWRADKHPAQYLHDFRRNTGEVRSVKYICCFLKGFGFFTSRCLLECFGFYGGNGYVFEVASYPFGQCKIGVRNLATPFFGHVSISLELTKRNSSRAKGRSSLCTESPGELEGMEYERTRSDWMECQRFISCQIL